MPYLNVKKTIANTLVNKIILLAERSGIRIRQTLEENQKEKHLASSFRKDVAVCHGFRKFFTKQLVDSKLNPEIREMLMGHKIGLASVYYKPSDDDFLVEYQKAINNLTINELNKLKMQVKKLEIEKSEWQMLTEEVAELKRIMKSKHGKIRQFFTQRTSYHLEKHSKDNNTLYESIYQQWRRNLKK